MTVVAIFVQAVLQLLDLLPEQRYLLLLQPHLLLQPPQLFCLLMTLLLQQADFLSQRSLLFLQVDHFFYSHVPTVLGSRLHGKPFVLLNRYQKEREVTFTLL